MADPLGAVLLAEEVPEGVPEALAAQPHQGEGQGGAPATTAAAACLQQEQQQAPNAPAPTAVGPASRAAQFRAALAADCVDLRRLRELAWGGVPDGETDRGLRAAVWRLLLGLLPLERGQWERTLRRKRAEYAQFCEVRISLLWSDACTCSRCAADIAPRQLALATALSSFPLPPNPLPACLPAHRS